jgi:hypothetical protein
MLTGQAPFVHKDNWRVMSMHMNLPAPSPREMNPSIHPEMERIVLRGLAKDPAERFQSMEALRDALLAGPWAKVTGPIAVKSPDATFELMTTKLPIQGDTPSGPLARMASSPSGPSGPQPPAPSTTLGASAGEVSSRMRRVTLADASGAPPILPPGVAAPLEGRRMRNVLLAAGAVGIVGGLAVGIAIMFSNNEPGSTDTAPTTAAADDDEPRVSARKARTSDPEAEAATTAPVVRTDAPASAAESPAKTASVAVLTPEPAPATAEAVADVHTARVPGGKDGGEKAKPAATPRGTYLKFDVSPPGTRILVDGKSVGTTPLKGKVEVAPGRHTLDFVLPGKPAKSFAVDAVAGKTTPVVRKL